MSDLFKLDKHRLDAEWTGQVQEFAQAADQLAEARDAERRAKAKLELTEAEEKLAIRRNPQIYGFEKVTEGTVGELLTVSKKYQAALREHLDAEHAVDVYKVKVDALNQRKSALEDLVRLRLADYFSAPQAPPEASEKMNRVQQNHNNQRLARAGGRSK
jgi:hypothetical protein